MLNRVDSKQELKFIDFKKYSVIRDEMEYFFFSGLGYVVGRGLATAFSGDWHWALRGTPILGAVAVLLIIFVMKEPPRGEAEGHEQVTLLA